MRERSPLFLPFIFVALLCSPVVDTQAGLWSRWMNCVDALHRKETLDYQLMSYRGFTDFFKREAIRTGSQSNRTEGETTVLVRRYTDLLRAIGYSQGLSGPGSLVVYPFAALDRVPQLLGQTIFLDQLSLYQEAGLRVLSKSGIDVAKLTPHESLDLRDPGVSRRLQAATGLKTLVLKSFHRHAAQAWDGQADSILRELARGCDRVLILDSQDWEPSRAVLIELGFSVSFDTGQLYGEVPVVARPELAKQPDDAMLIPDRAILLVRNR